MTARKQDPIRKVVWRNGEVRYRFVIDVGEKGGKRVQECHTFRTMTEARAERSKMLADRSRGKLIKRTSITFDELCIRWLASRHDGREVTVLGYEHVLKSGAGHIGEYQGARHQPFRCGEDHPGTSRPWAVPPGHRLHPGSGQTSPGVRDH